MENPNKWSLEEIKETAFVVGSASAALALLFVTTWLAYIFGNYNHITHYNYECNDNEFDGKRTCGTGSCHG